jgi:hypothetical protein
VCEAPSCCKSTDACAGDETCAKSGDSPNGTCVKITGCGTAADHALVPWECGGKGCPVCQSGTCVNHQCFFEGPNQPVPINVTVEENTTIVAETNGTVCANCRVEVTSSTGSRFISSTDADGNVDFVLDEPGEYLVTIYRDGVPFKSIKLNARAKPVVDAGALESLAKLAMSPVAILAVAAILAFVLYSRYGRRRKKWRR